MTLWPIMERELRTACRKRSTYYLRDIAVALLLAASLDFIVNSASGSGLGAQLFGALHFTLFVAIWVFVPFLVADSLSRERREGTLGLLFLSRLTAKEVVIAKGFAHGLRAMTLWLAVLPLLTLPFPLGGVGWREVCFSVSVNLSSVFLALAAGLLASALSGVRTRVMLWAVTLSLAMCFGYVLVHFLVVIQRLGFFQRLPANPFMEFIMEFIGGGFRLSTNGGGIWSQGLSRFSPTQNVRWLQGEVLIPIGALCVLWLVIAIVAWQVRRVWREEPHSERIDRLVKRFCRPILFQRFLQRWTGRRLQANPIGWLEQRTWNGRVVSWAWLGFVLFVSSLPLLDPQRDSIAGEVYRAAAWFMGTCLALSAVGSLRRERESGVLELLLISPMGERGILWGRVRALWVQFAPGTVCFALLWALESAALNGADLGITRSFGAVVFCLNCLVTAPVIGLYFSLRLPSFPAAFLATMIAAVLVPFGIIQLSELVARSTGSGDTFDSWKIVTLAIATSWQAMVGLVCWLALLVLLRQRAFALRST